MFVKFYYAPAKSGEDESGIPVYTDAVFVQITMDPTNTVDRKARDSDFERFPEQYEYFLKANAKYEPIENQVPLEMWAMCTPADVANLRARNIRTVEALAAVSADMIKKMPPSVSSLVESAKNYLSMAGSVNKNSEKADRLIQENANLREEVGVLKAQIAALKKEKADA